MTAPTTTAGEGLPPPTFVAPPHIPAPPEYDTEPVPVRRRSTTRRSSATRRHLALGGAATAGVVVITASTVLSPLAAIVAAGAAVLVPASIVVRRLRRRGGRGRGRVGGMPRRSGPLFGGRGGGLGGGRGGGLGGMRNPFRRSGAGGAGGAGANPRRVGSANQAGGIPKPNRRGGAHRGAPRGVTARGATPRTPKVNRGGASANPPNGRTPNGRTPNSNGRTSNSRTGDPSRSGRTPRPGRTSSGALGRVGRLAGRAARGAARGVAAPFVGAGRLAGRTGRAALAGARGSTGVRDAYRRARADAQRRWFSGLLGGVLAGAWRGGITSVRYAARHLRKAYADAYKPYAGPVVPVVPISGQLPVQPVPSPAPRPRTDPGPSQPQNPTAGPAARTTGGTMPAHSPFPPHDAAIFFYSTAARFWPGRHSGALFDFQHAVNLMGETAWYWANGWKIMADHIEKDLSVNGGGGLHPDFVKALADMFRLYATGADIARGLPSTFVNLHGDALNRARTPGSHVSNVPAHA